MPTIEIVVAYRHRPGTIRDLQTWLAGPGMTLLASALGAKERYVGMYMIEGDPTYTLELRTRTTDASVLEELETLNTEQFSRGQTVMKLLWRFLDQTVPPRVHFSRALHEASPPPR